MAGSVNECTFIGNLGADPEVRLLQSGKKVVNLRIACSESWKDKETGERKEKTEWIPIVIWNEGLAKVAEQYLKKGAKIYVKGVFQTRKWEKDGQTHYTSEIVLQGFGGSLVMLDGKRDGDSAPARQEPAKSEPAKTGPYGTDINDSDIPF